MWLNVCRLLIAVLCVCVIYRCYCARIFAVFFNFATGWKQRCILWYTLALLALSRNTVYCTLARQFKCLFVKQICGQSQIYYCIVPTNRLNMFVYDDTNAARSDQKIAERLCWQNVIIALRSSYSKASIFSVTITNAYIVVAKVNRWTRVYYGSDLCCCRRGPATPYILRSFRTTGTEASRHPRSAACSAFRQTASDLLQPRITSPQRKLTISLLTWKVAHFFLIIYMTFNDSEKTSRVSKINIYM